MAGVAGSTDVETLGGANLQDGSVNERIELTAVNNIHVERCILFEMPGEADIVWRLSPDGLRRLQAIATARKQSLEETIAACCEPAVMQSFPAEAFDDRPALTERDLEPWFAKLPTLDEAERTHPEILLSLTTHAGMTLVVRSCDNMGPTRCVRGVMLFPGETLDRDREQPFILVELRGEMHFTALSNFEKAAHDMADDPNLFRVLKVTIGQATKCS